MSKRQLTGESDPNDCILVESDISTHREQSKRRTLSRKVICRLQQKLDSNLFERYLENLWGTFTEEQKASCTYLDSVWFALYTKESMKAKVLNWINRKDIFSKKYVFMPIVIWSHWSLLVFCHLGENLQSERSKPCMLLLDSLHMAEPRRLEPTIRKFVLDIYNVERPEKKREVSRIPLLVPKVPQQRGDEECGYFVLYFIKLFVCRAPENFIIEDYPYFMKEDWFEFEEFESFRVGLR